MKFVRRIYESVKTNYRLRVVYYFVADNLLIPVLIIGGALFVATLYYLIGRIVSAAILAP